MTTTIIQGDALERLRELPSDHFHCVITSPPYWGLRDYGTGTWEGGDAACGHRGAPQQSSVSTLRGNGHGGGKPLSPQLQAMVVPFRDVCGKCGARRIDQQIGLEETPEAWCARLVEVFREVRRVLRSDGVCFVNIGDSYCSGTEARRAPTQINGQKVPAGWSHRSQATRTAPTGDIKPKDLVGQPWMLAFALRADGWWLRSEITWCKVNAMPESCRDRPTKATEKVFLLTKKPRYYFDAVALAQACSKDAREALRYVSDRETAFGLLQAQEWSEPGRDLQSMRESEDDILAADADRPSIGVGNEQTLSSELGWINEASSLSAIDGGHGMPASVCDNGEGQSVCGEESDQRSSESSSCPILPLGQGKDHEQAISGDRQGSGKPSAGCTQAARAHVGAIDLDGIRVEGNQGALRERLHLLQSNGQASDAGSRDAALEGRAARRREHRASLSELQQPQGKSAPNARDFWILATDPLPGITVDGEELQHYASFPVELARRCILAGTSAKGCCPECGAPWARVVETAVPQEYRGKDLRHGNSGNGMRMPDKWNRETQTTGWRPTCSCETWGSAHNGGCYRPPPIPCRVLDPFGGSGRTALAAEELQRDCTLIELNPASVTMAKAQLERAKARRFIGDAERVKPLPGQMALW